MNVRERARLLQVQSSQASDSTGASSGAKDLRRSRVSRSNESNPSTILKNNSSLRSTPTVQTRDQNVSETEPSEASTAPEHSINLLSAAPVSTRSQSSYGRLQKSTIKKPPPIPSKSDSTIKKFNALRLAQKPAGNSSGLPRPGQQDNPELYSGDEAPIIMVNNDPGPNVGSSPPDYASSEHVQPNEEISQSSDSDPEVSLQHATRQLPNFSKNVFGSVQSLVTTGPLKPPEPAELGRRISQTMNPLFNTVKENFDKAVVVAKPVAREIGRGANRGFDEMRNRTQTVLDKSGVSKMFMKTQDDIADCAMKLKCSDGLCSKCRVLPASLKLSNEAKEALAADLEWATPLSRVIYHADWCRICRLLLEVLCEPSNDPLQHSAVAPNVQPELSGLTFRDWVAMGWEFTDQHWPFGHGAKRHEGATYILGPGGQTIERILTRGARVFVDYSSRRAVNRNRRWTEVSRRHWHQEQLQNAREPNKYPLSCVLKISTTANSDSASSGILFVNLFGFGRKLGAELQILSSFRLRAVTSTSSSTASEIAQARPRRSPHIFSYGRLLDSNWIEPSVGRLWLRECEDEHGSECNQHGWAVAMQKPSFLRVIDVEDFCVKEMAKPAECRYIALSYVWGGATTVKLQHANIDTLMRKNGLLQFMHALPKSILDAIEVVHGMGERYLWTDALCILQENTKEALEQISSMDRVYGSALATIIVAQGKTADAGIQGIRQCHVPQVRQKPEQHRQLHQITAKIDDDISLVVPLSISDHNVDGSVWNARAWTFQERLLSRRLVIFTHGQMLWHCRKMICREDMTVADSGVPYTPLQWLSLKPRYLGVDAGRNWIDGSIEITRHGATQLVRSATFAEYIKAIEQYTHREMSYQSDILNAFAGLVQIFSRCFKSKTCFGLPECLLDIGLLWEPTQQLTRRKGFPSWSWAGWTGQVTFDKPFRITRGVDGKFVSYTTEECGEEGIRPLIRWHVWDDSSHKIYPVNGNGLGFPYKSAVLPKEWENGPYCFDERGHGAPRHAPPIPSQPPSISPETLNQCLIFWASSTKHFHLGTIISQQSDRQWNAAKAPRRYRLIDADSDIVGYILLDGVDDSWINQGRHELVQIAEAQYLGLDNEVKDIEDCPLYLVMLIEWDEQFKVAYRLGLGKVQKTAWMLAQPRLKLVYLG